MKTILSWDVGIKNLAYCLIKKNNETDFEILKWGVINLLMDDQVKCQFELRGGGQCQEIAKYCVYHRDKKIIFGENEGNMLVCSRHKEKSIPVIRNLEEEKLKLKKLSKKSLKKSLEPSEVKQNIKSLKCCCDCDEDVTYVLGNSLNCWCKNHFEKKGKQFIKKIHAKKISVTSCSKQPIQDLAEKLFVILDSKLEDFLQATEVLIENQPTLKNPKMKTLSSILYSYFVLRCITDKNKYDSKIQEVRFVSPSNKLKVNSNTTDTLIKKEKEKKDDQVKNVYKLTKTLGVKYCKAIINESDIKKLEEVKKKDDMCDAFLQGFQYLFSPIPEIYFKKLQSVGFEPTDSKKKTKSNVNKKNKLSDSNNVSNFESPDDSDDEKPKKTKNVKKNKISSVSEEDVVDEKPKKSLKK